MQDQNARALIVAYFFSKFDSVAYSALGYASRSEAHQDVGNILGVKPSTVKNMRDEFDPIHSNHRHGWYQRELRPSRQKVVSLFSELSEAALFSIVRDLLEGGKPLSLDYLFENKEQRDLTNESYIARGVTGRQAEDYFKLNWRTMPLPYAEHIEDTRNNGCGYDFALWQGQNFYAIEIKGVAASSGGVSFTDKEWDVALRMGDKYFLVVVKNLDQTPEHRIICNPTNILPVCRRENIIVQVCWNVNSNFLL